MNIEDLRNAVDYSIAPDVLDTGEIMTDNVKLAKLLNPKIGFSITLLPNELPLGKPRYINR